MKIDKQRIRMVESQQQSGLRSNKAIEEIVNQKQSIASTAIVDERDTSQIPLRLSMLMNWRQQDLDYFGEVDSNLLTALKDNIQSYKSIQQLESTKLKSIFKPDYYAKNKGWIQNLTNICQPKYINVFEKVVELAQKEPILDNVTKGYCIQYQIKHLQNSILRLSIIAVRTNRTNIYRVILDQALTVNQFYIAKKQFDGLELNKYQVHYQPHEVENQSLCHYCCEIKLKTEMKKCGCRFYSRTQLPSSQFNNPYQYLHENYYLEKIPNRYKFHYQFYNKSNSQFVCQRYCCKNCEKLYFRFEKNNCSYCNGTCDCQRCTKCDSLIKLKALYMLNGNLLEEYEQESFFCQLFKCDKKFRQQQSILSRRFNDVEQGSMVSRKRLKLK